MEINLVTISRISSEIIDKDIMKIERVDQPVLEDLTNNIYDKYPSLYQSGKYSLFWQYAKFAFLPINNYITYLAAIRLMAHKTIYLLVDDIYEYWEDNISYLLELDRIELEEKVERERDIYDVRITREKSMDQITNQSPSIHSSSTDSQSFRDEEQILSYAIRGEPISDCCTIDLSQMVKFIRDLKKGYPKIKQHLHTIPNVVFEKRVYKDPKGGKDKKSKKGDKDGKKDKGGKKKGGKKK